jgi:alpha-1,2-glucosyltransferase
MMRKNIRLSGHKEFHTAGLHIPQMLYIWPYFVFFSWPLLVIAIANLIVPSGYLPKIFDYGFSNKKRLPGIITATVVISFMLATIHFNTIVHPFTLADNRHYVFYIFRILTRYHPAVKYAVAPIYFLCAWAVIAAFGFSARSPEPRVPVVPTSIIDSATAQQSAKQQEQKSKKKEKENKRKATAKGASQKASSTKQAAEAQQEQRRQVLTPEIVAQIQAHILLRQQRQEQQQTRVSFVIIWLIATALSLITAPLVEPRYFIIPWVIWRLHLPRQPTPQAYRGIQRQGQGPRDETEIFKAKFAADLPQILETIWFIAVNAITGYVFLYKGFEWPQEPGKVQRFMW